MNKSTNCNIFDKYMKEIFHKMYLANVSNRLRELENPRIIDGKRWVWELVQNAKDSIVGSQDKTSIDIKIIVEGNSYKFLHNGSPFTIETLTALLYKFSEGKRNDGESTGRFGTGFLTTHSLSKIVKITSDYIDKEDSKIYGFSVTMYREGEGKELLDGLKKTENSFEKFQDTFGWTTYEYNARTDANKLAGNLGIQNFKENIVLVMLFCPEINSIVLNDNGKIFSIEHINNSYDTKNKCEKFHKSLFKVNDNGEISKRIFLSYKINEYNEKLTKKFEKERNLRICCALELDEKNNIKHKNSIPCLFCSLPLVGSERHQFPFFVNSPDFEPDSERASLLLDGKEINESTGKISEPGINKMILLRITDIYRDFLDYICKTDIRKRYFLISGINSIPQINFFDSKWYEKNFISFMRNIALEYPIVWNGKDHITLTDVFIPVINCYDDKEKQIKVYNYISELNHKRVPSFNESKIFEKIIWKNDSRIKFKDLENCIKMIDECKNISNLSKIINKNVWEWIDDFLLFIKNYHYEYFMNLNCAIIPNMNSEFVVLDLNFASSKDVPENMIECMENLGIRWREEHLHKNLINFTIGMLHNIKYAVSKILECVDKWSDKVLFLMQYIPNDSISEYQKKREMIYELCSIIFKDKKLQKKDGTKFPEEIWDKFDVMVCNKIIEKIKEYGHICNECSIEFINKFLIIINKYYPNFINYSIFPNKNGKFCQINNLYKEDNIPDIFKECLKNCFDYDINEELIDDRIDYANSLKKKNIYDFVNTLNLFFKNNENNIKKIEGYEYLSSLKLINKKAAEYLIKIIPKKSDNLICEKQRKLFLIYEFFKQINCNYYEINISELNDNHLWEYSNRYIYDIIREIIEEYDDINSLAERLGESKESIIKKLKEFIKFSKAGKIFLNQNNNFCKIDDLFNEKEWNDGSEKLKEIALYLDYDVRKELVHESMGNPCSKDMCLKEICNKIDEIMDTKFKEISNHQNKNFRNAAKCLSEYFDEIGEVQAGNLFRCTFSIKEKIAYNVIYDEKIRKNFFELDKLIGINNLSELSKNIEFQNLLKLLNKKRLNNSEISSILKDLEIESFSKDTGINDEKKQYLLFEEKFGKNAISKLMENSDKEKFVLSLIKDEQIFNNFLKYNIDSYKIFFENPKVLNSILNGNLSDNSYSVSSKITSENKSINISFNSEITKDKALCDFYRNSLSSFLYYASDFDFGNSNPIKIIGASGEAYIYELLSSSRKYKNVKWNLLDNSGKGEDFEYNGKHYKIHNDFSHYDILVETFDDRKIYVEVKSSKNSFSNRVPFYISHKQIEKMEKIEFPNEYVLAVVFNVMSQPKHFFMTLRNNI